MAFLCPDAPDTSGINDAARANADIAREALNFYRGAYEKDVRPAQQRQQQMTESLGEDYLDTSRQQKTFAKEQNQYYKDTFQPIEKQMARDAMEYDSDANVKKRSGIAAANVNQQFSNAIGQRSRMAGRYGLSSSTFANQAAGDSRAQALGAAGAQTGAAFDTMDKGVALRAGAANFGRNMPNTASTYFSGANQAGAGAMNAGQAQLSNTMAGANFMGQGFGMAMQGNNSAGSLYGSEANVLNTSRGQDLQFLSSMMPKATYAMSDVNAKKDIDPVSDGEALQAVKQTPVSRWTYKGGMGDGGRHTGPMAQDVNKTMGEQAAPGGKAIDLVSLNGINMAATAALARKVDRLENILKGARS